jgi:hypothetical protein
MRHTSLRGVMDTIWQLAGPGGVLWKANANGIEARNPTDTGFVVGRGAPPVGVDDWVTLAFYNAGGSLLFATGTINYPTTGAPPQDNVLWTLPNKQLIQYAYFRAETPLVGAGSVTLRAGITVGGNEILVDQAITAATVAGAAAGRVWGWDIAETGLSMVGQKGYAYEGVAGDIIRSRMTVAGVVTGGSLRYWIAGADAALPMRLRRRLPAYLGVPNPVMDLHAACYLPPVAPFAVSSWPSIRPATTAVAQGVAAAQPTHVVVPNIGPGVLFDQVNDVMGPTSVIASSAVDWTALCCFTTPAALAVNAVHYLWGASAASANGCFLQGTVFANWGWQTNGIVLLSGEAMPAGTHVAVVTKVGATYNLYRDGGALLATMAIVAQAIDMFTLNMNSGAGLAGGLAGGLHRMVIYASALSAADRNLATARLLQEWN